MLLSEDSPVDELLIGRQLARSEFEVDLLALLEEGSSLPPRSRVDL